MLGQQACSTFCRCCSLVLAFPWHLTLEGCVLSCFKTDSIPHWPGSCSAFAILHQHCIRMYGSVVHALLAAAQ